MGLLRVGAKKACMGPGELLRDYLSSLGQLAPKDQYGLLEWGVISEVHGIVQVIIRRGYHDLCGVGIYLNGC